MLNNLHFTKPWANLILTTQYLKPYLFLGVFSFASNLKLTFLSQLKIIYNLQLFYGKHFPKPS